MSCMIGYLDAEGFRNCGTLRYWTLSNLPLFLLATPVISVMVASRIWGLQHQRVETHNLSKGNTGEKHSIQNEADFPILRNLAVSQLLLTLPTFTAAHLQIISRLSSAYPVWWFESQSLVGGKSSLGKSAIRISNIIWLVANAGFFFISSPSLSCAACLWKVIPVVDGKMIMENVNRE
jgi:phosphatidylinositol glycan class V